MNIGSINSSYGAFSSQSVQRTPEAAELKKSGPGKDGDTDDSAAKAVQASPSPSVNTNGQMVGQIINVAA